MSKIQVDTIDTRSGTSTMQIGSTNTTTITLGVSGDTINVPSGVTIANAGTATGFGVAGTNLFEATMSASQTSVSDSTWTKFAFNQESYDADSVFDTSNNRFIAPAAGKYFLVAKGGIFPNTANGNKGQTRFYKNGSSVTSSVGANIGLAGGSTIIGEMYLTNAMVFDLAEDDYIEYFGWFNPASGVVTFDSSGSVLSGWRLL